MPDPNQVYAALAYVLRRHRLDSNLSQEQVAKAAGLTRNVVGRLEDAERPFSAAQIIALAAVFNVPGWQFMQEAENAVAAGEIPQLPASIRRWRGNFGFNP